MGVVWEARNEYDKNFMANMRVQQAARDAFHDSFPWTPISHQATKTVEANRLHPMDFDIRLFLCNGSPLCVSLFLYLADLSHSIRKSIVFHIRS